MVTARPGAHDVAGAGGAGPSGGADRTAPAISGLKLAARPTLRRGAKLQLRLSEAATIRVVAERLLPGRRTGRRCVAKGSGKRCVRVVRLTSVTVSAKSGALTISLAGKRLKRGSVRFTVIATDASGNASKAARVPASSAPGSTASSRERYRTGSRRRERR